MAASRFEHSVGVCFLARKLCEWRSSLREHRDLLMAAGLCHDIGSPPFSHISELFFYDATGRTHEQQTELLLAPGTELADLLESYKVDPVAVVDIINGRHETLGSLISGTIDLDNVDNSIHLLVSLGYHDEAPYHPMRLLKAFRYRNGQASLDTAYLSEIVGWQEGRKMLYEVLHSEAHLSSATMLYRALEYAYAEKRLQSDFFSLDESDAIHQLRRRSGKSAAHIVERALRWQQYDLLYQQLTPDEDPRLASLYADWRGRKRFTDRLAKELGIDLIDFAMYVGRDRGEKPIDLPFTGKYAEAMTELFASRRGPQRLALFSTKEHRSLRGTKKLDRAVKAAIAELPEADVNAHVFF